MNKETVDKIMQSIPFEWRYYWCESKICCCLGCVNKAGGAVAKGITKSEWEEWVKDNPTPVSFVNSDNPVWKDGD